MQAAAALSAVALVAALALLLVSSYGVHPIARRTRYFGSAALTRGVDACVLAAAALSATVP